MDSQGGEQFVIKRNGEKVPIDWQKFFSRITHLCSKPYRLHENVDVNEIVRKTTEGVYPDISTVQLDELACRETTTMMVFHPDYGILAARIAMAKLYKETPDTFSEAMDKLYKHGTISQKINSMVQQNAKELNSLVVNDRDFDYSILGFRTMEKAYLLRINGKIVERPQYMMMRVAVALNLEYVMEDIIETYTAISEKMYTHATPTLLNAGVIKNQLSSCFLATSTSSSIADLFHNILPECVDISSTAGGLSINFHNAPANGSFVSDTDGISRGIVPRLRVFNSTTRLVNQGDKRKGPLVFFLEPWHADIIAFLDLKKNTGVDEERTRDLFTALWLPNLFFERVRAGADWTLMCPSECEGLSDCYGAEFEKLYTSYENDPSKKYNQVVKARDIWQSIIMAQIETGTPYMLLKDECNEKSNHKHLGTIKSSNLCAEIIHFSNDEETGVCTLGSLALPKFVTSDGTFNFEEMGKIVKLMVRNLNRVIDTTFYPSDKAKLSNDRHRSIGIGVQGLADTYMQMKFPFDSEEAADLNKLIFEKIYFSALESSCTLAKKYGTYESYKGSPVSEGILQTDMWGIKDENSKLDWAGLRADIAQHGLRNSLLTACMPTASTASILGNNESIEPYTSNIFTRRVMSGEFQIVNPHMVKDLLNLNMWNDSMKNRIIANKGSIQDIENIPQEIKDLYKTVWELSMKPIMKQSADRGPYCDHSQSLNLFIGQPTYQNISSMLFYGYELRLKTLMYYLRGLTAVTPVAVTTAFKPKKPIYKCDDNESCIMCSA